jgi:hypothetical protein
MRTPVVERSATTERDDVKSDRTSLRIIPPVECACGGERFGDVIPEGDQALEQGDDDGHDHRQSLIPRRQDACNPSARDVSTFPKVAHRLLIGTRDGRDANVMDGALPAERIRRIRR